MANDISPEWPVANDALWRCEITRSTVNTTTGVIEEAPLVGANDVIAFASASNSLSAATPIHASLQVTLTNVTGTGVYFAYVDGDVAQLRLLPTYKDQTVYVHFVKGTGDWHEVAETIVTDQRAAVG